MRFRKIISGTFTGVPFLTLHAFVALRAMFVALGISRCMFFLPHFLSHSFPLLSPLLLSVVSVGYFRELFVLGQRNCALPPRARGKKR